MKTNSLNMFEEKSFNLNKCQEDLEFLEYHLHRMDPLLESGIKKIEDRIIMNLFKEINSHVFDENFDEQLEIFKKNLQLKIEEKRKIKEEFYRFSLFLAQLIKIIEKIQFFLNSCKIQESLSIKKIKIKKKQILFLNIDKKILNKIYYRERKDIIKFYNYMIQVLILLYQITHDFKNSYDLETEYFKENNNSFILEFCRYL